MRTYYPLEMCGSISLYTLFLIVLRISFTFCEEEPSHSIQLTTIDFNTEIGSNNYFVMFFAPWCSYCVKLKPTWEELAEMLNEPGSRVKIAKVDCTTESGICKQQQITSYPTLLYYRKGNKDAVKYAGTRDLSSLANFLNDQLGTNVVEQGTDALRPGPIELTDETYSDHLAKGRHFVKFYAPWCGHCQSLSPTWENVGILFAPHESVTIGKIDCTVQKEACRTYDIKSYPTLLWIENGQKIEKYQGVRSVEDLQSYIEDKLASPEEPLPLEVEEKTVEEIPPVIHLVGDTFDEGIKKGFTFVKYFAPWCGHCKGLAPTWHDLGEKFSDREDVTIADVDCTREENKQLCDEQEVDGFPTLILYKNGERLDKYTGSRGLSDLYKFVGKHLADNYDHDEL